MQLRKRQLQVAPDLVVDVLEMSMAREAVGHLGHRVLVLQQCYGREV